MLEVLIANWNCKSQARHILTGATYSPAGIKMSKNLLINCMKNFTPAIAEIGGDDLIKGIGVGAPNGNYYNGTIEYAPNLQWRGIVPLADLITAKV